MTDYRDMTRDEAVEHFGQREQRIKDEILALPLAEKFMLVSEFLSAPVGEVAPSLALSVARLAVAELEAKHRKAL